MKKDFAKLKKNIINEQNILQHKLENFSQKQELDVNGRCEELMRTRFERYDKLSREFSKFFSQDELSIQLERKANISMVDQVVLIKADKEEVAHTNVLIENLNERLKYLSVVQNELASTLEPIRNSVNSFDEGLKK